MSNDIAQINLREPEQVDWEHYSSGSTYQAPPPALGNDGKPIVYYGLLRGFKEADKSDDGYLNLILDPIEITRSGAFDKTLLKFTRASVKPFQRNGENIKGNPNKLANFLRAVGLQVRPQTNEDYLAAVKASLNKPFAFTIDWEGYNRDTGEAIRGFLSFPEDSERPGQRKSILKRGDLYNITDVKGAITGTGVVQSEIVFANARVKYFNDATPKVVRG